jgi:hypothetical protein
MRQKKRKSATKTGNKSAKEEKQQQPKWPRNNKYRVSTAKCPDLREILKSDLKWSKKKQWQER